MSAMCCAGMNFAASRCMKEYAAGISSSEISLVDVPTTSRDVAAAVDAASSAGTAILSAPAAAPVSAPAAATVDRFLTKATKKHAAGHVDQPIWASRVLQ